MTLILRHILAKYLGGYMIKKFLMKWLIPNALDYLVKEGKEFLDNPETHDDDDIVKNMVDSNRKYAEYKLNKIID